MVPSGAKLLVWTFQSKVELKFEEVEVNVRTTFPPLHVWDEVGGVPHGGNGPVACFNIDFVLDNLFNYLIYLRFVSYKLIICCQIEILEVF